MDKELFWKKYRRAFFVGWFLSGIVLPYRMLYVYPGELYFLRGDILLYVVINLCAVSGSLLIGCGSGGTYRHPVRDSSGFKRVHEPQRPYLGGFLNGMISAATLAAIATGGYFLLKISLSS